VAAIDELTRNYRVSMVLCTATQPALEAPAFEGGLTGVRELAPEPTRLFKQLQRVRVRHLGALSDYALARHMRSRDQVLCIVNNRRHARAVYQAMADNAGGAAPEYADRKARAFSRTKAIPLRHVQLTLQAVGVVQPALA
jgi:CRISPR-associated endonuclease/helicase Cas3